MRKTTSHLAVAGLAAALACLVTQWSHLPSASPLPAVNAQTAPAAANFPELSAEESANVQVYQKVNRGVVHITTRSVQIDDFFLTASTREGTGSGSFLDRQGRIVTNNHVIEEARQIQVTLFDGSDWKAKLVGADPVTDVAVIQIDAPPEKLNPVPWGDSEKMLVGMRVFAIGNPFGLERTLTAGIVSSLNRSLRMDNGRVIRGVIQTDAALNPGSSGGPLLNRKGEMVGLNTAIISRLGQSSGVSMAVPSSTARRVVEELIKHGRVLRPESGIVWVWQTDQGLRVARLAPNSPATRAGLREPEEVVVRQGPFIYRTLDRSRSDVIVAADGKPVKTPDDLMSLIEAKKPGDSLVLSLLRDGERKQVTIKLEEPQN